MKKFILIIIISITLNSCSKQDCRLERLEIIEKYNSLIIKASGNQEQQLKLQIDKEMALAKLNC